MRVEPLSLHLQYLHSSFIFAAFSPALELLKSILKNLVKMKYDCVLFDLDDTLYPLSSGISTECLKNIGDFMVERLRIEQSKIPDLCNLLYKNYGTTMAGLRAIGYNFNYDDYHSFVHGRLPYEKLKPDPVLRHLLQSLPIRKVVSIIFKNRYSPMPIRFMLQKRSKGLVWRTVSRESYAFETLNLLLSDFDQERAADNIFDIVGHFSHPNSGAELPKTPILCKPSVEAMEHALRIAGIDPQTTIFFEDSVRNIQSAKRVGNIQSANTVLVGTSHRVKGADHALESIHNIKEAFPELLEETEKSEAISSLRKCWAGNISISLIPLR